MYKGHQPKPSVPCKVIEVKKLENNQLQYRVRYEDDSNEVVVSQAELKAKSPRALCDYLLSKINFNKKKK